MRNISKREIQFTIFIRHNSFFFVEITLTWKYIWWKTVIQQANRSSFYTLCMHMHYQFRNIWNKQWHFNDFVDNFTFHKCELFKTWLYLFQVPLVRYETRSGSSLIKIIYCSFMSMLLKNLHFIDNSVVLRSKWSHIFRSNSDNSARSRSDILFFWSDLNLKIVLSEINTGLVWSFGSRHFEKSPIIKKRFSFNFHTFIKKISHRSNLRYYLILVLRLDDLEGLILFLILFIDLSLIWSQISILLQYWSTTGWTLK